MKEELKIKFKNCVKCGVAFTCNDSGNSCWCNQYQLSEEKLKELRDKFDNCLCEKCLSEVSKGFS